MLFYSAFLDTGSLPGPLRSLARASAYTTRSSFYSHGLPWLLARCTPAPLPTPFNFTMSDDDNSSAAAAVSFKAPPFCSQDPSIWFSILECGFKTAKITNSLTRYTHAVSLLPADVLPQVSDVIASAYNSDHAYEDLKTALLQRFQSSVATRLRELLSKEELGNEKPTDLLRRMKQLLGEKYQSFDPDLFKQLFYQRLPPAVQRSLFSVKDDLKPDAIAKLADEFMATLPGPLTSSVSSVVSERTTQFDELVKQVSLLATKVTSLERLDRRHSRSPTPHRRRRRSRSKSPGLCWYHNNFGEKATRCTTPCTYKASNSKDEH